MVQSKQTKQSEKGGLNVKSRNWVRLFLSTLAVGGVTTGLVGFALKWDEYQVLFINFDIGEILALVVWFIGVGFIFSMISQAGFFAYLTVHRFGLGFFRSSWNITQLVLILFVLFDIVYFRDQFFTQKPNSIDSYLSMAGLIVLAAIVISFMKTKQTNNKAFVPTLFFMIVVTIIEWYPAIRTNDTSWLFLMLIPLIVCNAYQLLVLPKLLEHKKEKAVEA